MKSFLIILILFFSSCETMNQVASESTQKTETIEVKKPETPKSVKMALAWGAKPEWDKYLADAVNSKPWPVSVEKPCKKVDLKECVMQLISIMAKYESNFKPETNFTESFNDSKGKPVISRGLLQISQESANQKAYNCKIKDAKELNDSKINLECAVNIIHFQAVKHNSLMGEPKKGCAAYWSVCRASSKSNAKILNYLSEF